MQASNDPKLSVVVPIYNVERYLDECLASVAGQKVQDFEGILVDDGSADNSTEIAAKWCEADSRFRLVQQENHGLGHARNTGARHATGTYLAFLDSDDMVPPDAYRTMIETLEKTGSDFATGNVHRFDSSGVPKQWAWLRSWPETEQLRTHVSRKKLLLRDHLAHNKVWRRSFWEKTGLEFPVGVLYEDIPTTIPAHARARTVDLVPIVAVLWRIRDQGDVSITQNRNRDASHIRDRVDGMLTASRSLDQFASRALKIEYDTLVLRRDLKLFIDLFLDVDDQYQAELFSSIDRFLKKVSPEALRRVPVDLRLAYALIDAGALEDFQNFMAMRRDGRVSQLPVVVRNNRAMLDLALPNHTRLPDDVLDTTNQLKVLSKVSDLNVTDSNLVIDGWAHIPRIPVRGSEAQLIKVWFAAGRRKVWAKVTYRRDARASAHVGATAEATGRVAFTASVPIRSLRRWPKWRATTWRVMVAVENSGIERRTQLKNPLTGKAERPIMRRVSNDQWLRLRWADEGLTCRVRAESALLTGVSANDEAFTFFLRTISQVGKGARIMVRRTDGDEGVSFPATPDPASARHVHVVIPRADLPGIDADDPDSEAPKSWDVLFQASKSKALQSIQDPGPPTDCSIIAGRQEIGVRQTRGATIYLAAGSIAPVLTAARWTDDGTLSLTLTHTGGVPFESVVLQARSRHEEVEFPISTDGTVLTATLPVFALPRFDETVPLRAGTWDLTVRSGDTIAPIRIGQAVLESLPAESLTGDRRAVLTDSKRRSLCLIAENELLPEERGWANQSRLRSDTYPRLKTAIRDAVLYDVHRGRSFADSPRHVFDELRTRDADLEHLVVVRSQRFTVPKGAVAIPYRSKLYYEALAQSQFIVTNNHLPTYFQRAEGQTVLQTWHGIGTKKIGLDIHSRDLASKSYVENIRDGAANNWEYLVSPSQFASPIMRRALAFSGTLLETGAPRNDIFYRPDRDDVAAHVKRRLGIPAHKSVVLYAPTWRDNELEGSDGYRVDLNRAAKQLGDDYAVVFRAHPRAVDRLPSGDASVIDASDYPDVHQLLLISDVLITDYSSLMCDFANTGRPVLIYAYDLADYAEKFGGFYFDFEHEVPGPLITDEADLVPAILDAEKILVENETKYQAFHNRFLTWDDGNATSRVVDAVFGMGR